MGTTGTLDLFVGSLAGRDITTGTQNTIVGGFAGLKTTIGSSNSFFGSSAGGGFGANGNVTGTGNSFFGASSGVINTIGNYNTSLGYAANFGANNLTNANAIGANALASTSNSMVLGSINGVNSATADTNVGIGTTAPVTRLHVVGSSWFQGDNSPLPATAGKGIIVGSSGNLGYISSFDYSTFTPQVLLLNNGGGNVGIGTNTPKAKLDVSGGNLIVTSPGQGIILKSPNGATCKLLTLNDAGALALATIACP